MDNSLPLSPEPKENEESGNKKCINFDYEGENYILEIEKDETGNYMTIILSNVDSLPIKKYKANYSFESLKKKNEYLNRFS